MSRKILIPIVISILFISAIFAYQGAIVNFESDTETNTNRITACPTWSISDYWHYSIETHHFTNTEAFMICYDDVDGNYMIGTNDRNQALVHSLFNVNPMLGRITKDNLGVYENGIVKDMYQFPLEHKQTWKNTMFEQDLTVKVSYNNNIKTCCGEIKGYEIVAKNENGFEIHYNYINEIKWFSHFKVISADGIVLYELNLLDYGTGYSGTAYFMRGKDLYDSTETSTGLDDPTVKLDLIEVSGHPKYSDFDFLAINVQVEVEDSGWARVAIMNPNAELVYNKDILADKHDFVFSEVPNVNGNWEISYSLWTKSTAHVIIAGVLEYSKTI